VVKRGRREAAAAIWRDGREARRPGRRSAGYPAPRSRRRRKPDVAREQWSCEQLRTPERDERTNEVLLEAFAKVLEAVAKVLDSVANVFKALQAVRARHATCAARGRRDPDRRRLRRRRRAHLNQPVLTVFRKGRPRRAHRFARTCSPAARTDPTRDGQSGTVVEFLQPCSASGASFHAAPKPAVSIRCMRSSRCIVLSNSSAQTFSVTATFE
jgi:hypothetical protein